MERIQRRAARWCLRRYNNTSSVTNMLHGVPLSIVGFLTPTGYCALSCAGHVAHTRKGFKLACPLSIYPIF